MAGVHSWYTQMQGINSWCTQLVYIDGGYKQLVYIAGIHRWSARGQATCSAGAKVHLLCWYKSTCSAGTKIPRGSGGDYFLTVSEQPNVHEGTVEVGRPALF